MKGNFSEYTRLRDIAHKRAVRLEQAGLSVPIHIPTVKEIKAGIVSAGEAMKAVKNFLSEGSTVKAVKQTQIVPEFKQYPKLPKQKRKTEEERKQRKREQDRAYRRRKAIREQAKTGEQAKKHESYLKALDSVSKRFKSKGIDLGLDRLTPSQAKAFVAYMDYRFSQGDFSQHYIINDFVQDFSKLLSKGYKADEITKDFDKFLADQSRLENNANNMTGITAEESALLWDRFIDSDEEDEEEY